MPLNQHHYVLVAALTFVKRGDGVLLVRQNIDRLLWGIPGGIMEPGESVDEVAAREFGEETGLTIRVTRVVGFYSVPSEQALSITLEGEVTGGEIRRTTSETCDCQFFLRGGLPDQMRPYHRERIDDFFLGLVEPIFRMQ